MSAGFNTGTPLLIQRDVNAWEPANISKMLLDLSNETCKICNLLSRWGHLDMNSTVHALLTGQQKVHDLMLDFQQRLNSGVLTTFACFSLLHCSTRGYGTCAAYISH